DFHRSKYQKRKDEICPFSILAFHQPTTVDKEPIFLSNFWGAFHSTPEYYAFLIFLQSITIDRELNFL
ncbi:MAG: hypothetical protein E7H16_06770, partial [Streptococcus mitis]|nr:hypothetical protein [Streptococcus mitis]